ncbi:MAG: glycosyltransferase family 39 protein [Chloroflexi bacterium]|nr:glycosyltransferase family 39 protein [Chloroflexota bacterium]
MLDETGQAAVSDVQSPAVQSVSVAVPLLLPPPRRRSFAEGLKSLLHWFTYKESIAVCIVSAVILAIQLVNIANPQSYDTSKDPPTRNTIGDETYYVAEAYKFLHAEGIERPEHPPLGKWLIAAGMFLFGDNAVGWRIFPILFGTVSIFIFYFICLRLVRQEPDGSGTGELSPPMRRGASWFCATTFVPVLATFLFATENLSFVQAHTAMLDVFSITFMLLGFLLYLRGNYLPAGAMMGLSMLSKAMALLAVLAIVLHWALTRRGEILAEIKYTWNALRGRGGTPAARSEILSIIKLLLPVPVVWLALLVLLEYPATHQWASPIGRTLNMIGTHVSLSGPSYWSPTGIATKPWVWLVWPGGMYYSYAPRYLSSIGWTVWALIIPSTAYLVFEVVRRRARGGGVAAFALSWFVGVYGLLIVMEFAVDRLMYHFYFYPAAAAVCLAISWCAWRIWLVARKRPKTRTIFLSVLALYLLATVATFIIMGPYGTNLVSF